MEYTLESINVDPETIKDFEFMSYKRDLRIGHCGDISTKMKVLKVFQAPLVLNKVNNKYRIIDGNHRIEACRRVFRFDKAPISFTALVYNNLNANKERAIFSEFNLGARQTLTDYASIYWSVIPAVKHFTKAGVKVHPKASGDVIGFRTLVEPYLWAKHYGTRRSMKPNVFIENSQALSKKDCDKIIYAYKTYIKMYGEHDKKKIQFKPNFLMSVMFAVFVTDASDADMKKMFKQMSNKHLVHYDSSFSGTRDLIEKFLK